MASDNDRRRVAVHVNRYAVHAFETGIVSYARQQRWIVRFRSVDDKAVAVGDTLPVDGLIAMGEAEPEPSGPAIPKVLFVATATDGQGRHRVANDGVGVGRLAAEHFLARGHRHFAFYSHWGPAVVRERLRGFRESLTESGRSVTWLRGMGPGANLRTRLGTLPRPLAVLAMNDRQSLDVLDACQILDLDVPGEVAVLGVDDDHLAGDLAPIPLSSIDDSLHRKGVECARMLDRLMRGDADVPELVLVPPAGVVTRQSTDSIAVEHVVLAKALSRIREHAFDQTLTVDGIMEGLGMSRRGFYALFRRELDLSPWEYVTRLRVERAEELLADGDVRVNEAAPRCGFASASHLYQAFRKHTGMSPRQWRNARMRVYMESCTPGPLPSPFCP